MFNKPVVFVVGAGASKEFKFPLGAELGSAIASTLNPENRRYSASTARLFAECLSRIRLDELSGTAVDLMTAGAALSPTMKLQPSVDEALHYFAGDKRVIAVGKLALAFEILRSERNSFLPKEGEASSGTGYDAHSNNWLFKLLSMVLSGSQLRDARPLFRNVTIINFNYDRSLEHFLYLALTHNASLSPAAASDAISQLSVLRPYGSLGLLPWQDLAKGIPFGGADAHQPWLELEAAARNIRTFTEQFTDASLQSEIHRAVTGAALIVFLGFGFHRQNMALMTDVSVDKRYGAQVLATMHGVDSHNFESLDSSIQDTVRTLHRAILLDKTASQLLTDLRPMMMQIVG